jgi:hypothetical protein
VSLLLELADIESLEAVGRPCLNLLVLSNVVSIQICPHPTTSLAAGVEVKDVSDNGGADAGDSKFTQSRLT